MSTVGKVLVVLISLPTILWIWLASGLAELNRNYGKKTSETSAQIASALDETMKTRSEIFLQKTQIAQIQREKENQLTAKRSQISQLYSVDSYTKETLDRYALQFASMQQAEEAARGRLALAVRILADTNKELSDAQAELASLRDANTGDRETLAQLRKKLVETIQDNQQLVERRLGTATRSATPSARAIPTGSARASR